MMRGVIKVAIYCFVFTLWVILLLSILKSRWYSKRDILIRRVHPCVGPAKHGAGAGGGWPNDRFFNKGL